MKQLVLLACLCVLSLGGCTKFGKNITVKGRVLNPVTGEGVANIQIQIVRESGGLPGGYKEVKSTYTDSEGYFEISKLGWFQNYYIQAQVPDYPIGWKENGEPRGDFRAKIAKRHVVEMDYHTLPYGNLTLHIKNVNCFNNTDTMNFRWEAPFTAGSLGWSTDRLGCYDESSTSSIEVPMGYRYYETKVIRNGITTYVYDTIFVTATGVSHLELFY